ncbi:MAG TPA: hypothetical protein VK146_08655 [Tabrizicola sp.]|nr:hypothetical protein [Tabrizicola sp.]
MPAPASAALLTGDANGNRARGACVDPATNHPKETPMKGALAWLIGIPIPIIIILYLLDVF